MVHLNEDGAVDDHADVSKHESARLLHVSRFPGFVPQVSTLVRSRPERLESGNVCGRLRSVPDSE